MMQAWSRDQRHQRDIGEQQGDNGRNDFKIGSHGGSPLATGRNMPGPDVSALFPASQTDDNFRLWPRLGGSKVILWHQCRDGIGPETSGSNDPSHSPHDKPPIEE